MGWHLLGAVLLIAAAARAQTADAPPADEKVAEVRFTGLTTVTSGYANSIVRTSQGASFDQALVDADADRLLASGKFTAATAAVEHTAAGAVVTFQVAERTQIREIRFTGNRKFSDAKLRKEVPLQVGDPVDTFRVREGADAVLLVYRNGGYGEAKVTWDEQLLRSTGELLYTIEEGPRIRIRKIVFAGNENNPESELRKQITSNTYIWIFRDGKFDEETVEADAAAVQNYIRDQGYLDARVGYELDFSADRTDLTVTFTIAEGRRYFVQDIIFTGNTVFTNEELAAGLPLEVDAPIVQAKLDQSMRQITDKYGAIGYIYARVRPSRVFTEEPGYVRVTFEIEEGGQFRVGRIVVRGNDRTQDKVIRRELGLLPGELFDLPEARASEQRIQDLQLFKSASVAPVGDEASVRDVLVNIDEGRKAGDFLFGFGVTSNSGLVGSIVLDLKNFDLFDTPRSFSEFIKLRSFYGAGQRLRIEAQPGTELTRFRIDFTEPYLFDKPTRFDYSIYFFERGRESYDERRIGTTVSFGRRLKWDPLKDWYGEIAFRLESARVSNLDLFAPRDVRDDEGDALLTSVKTSLVRDRTDSRFLPTRGDRLRVAYEQFGVLGGEVFGQLSSTYTRHYTLATDELERKSVLSLKGTGSWVVGDAPVYERYYAGGIGSIRGFQFRGVSPRQGLDDDPVGGDFMLLFSSEYSFPLYGKVLRGLLFSDMGTVEENIEIRNWRVAVGAGVRVQVDFFGPIPLEFDLAVPVLSEMDDDEQVFSFFIGATF